MDATTEIRQVSGSKQFPESEVTEHKSPSLSLEQRIGEYWFAQLGIIILLLGLIFLISYAFNRFGPFWQVVTGYGVTGVIYGVYRISRKRYSFIANILFPGTLLLLYFVTLRMHFYNPHPLITNKFIGLLALLIVLGLQTGIVWKRQSEWMAFLPIVLGNLTALLSDTHQFALALIMLVALATALMLSIKHWQILGISGIVLSYGSYLLYLLNDPLLGKKIQILPQHDWMIVYLIVTLLLYAVVSFRPHVNDYLTRVTRIALTTFNSSGFYIVALLITFSFFRDHLAFWNFVFAGLLFGIATAHWTIRKSRYSTSFYSSFSYIALTVGILASTQNPYTYLWLVWQSALVIATAIWFQSNIIIWANTGIYTLVLAAYLFTADATWAVTINFVLVAVLSERLLIYARNRIATIPQFFHYLYILTGYAMMLYAGALILPAGYISIGWLLISIAYLSAGIILRYRPYRWIGFISFIIPVGRIFIIDLASLEPIYRIISFLVVGTGLLIIALFYARRI